MSTSGHTFLLGFHLRGLSLLILTALSLAACDKAGVMSTGRLPSLDQNGTGGNGNSPTVTLTANGKPDALVITASTRVTLAWSSQNADSCAMTSVLASSGTSVTESWGSTLSGAHDVAPTSEVTYTIVCSSQRNGNASAKVTLYVSQSCTGGKTSLTLLTSTIRNKADHQLIRYSVSYLTCDGKPAAVPSAQIWFDLAAFDSSGTDRLPYSISMDNGTVVLNGTMGRVWGEDLFGNTGSNYFHWLTDQTINFPSTVTSFILTADMSQTEMHSYNTDLNHIPSSETIDSFLRIGDSEPDVAPVTFLN